MAQAGFVRIGRQHHQTLRELSKRMGETMQTVVEKAIDELKREQFFEDFNAAYAGLKSDSQKWQKELEERQAFEGTLQDDLNRNEVWSENGSVVING